MRAGTSKMETSFTEIDQAEIAELRGAKGRNLANKAANRFNALDEDEITAFILGQGTADIHARMMDNLEYNPNGKAASRTRNSSIYSLESAAG